MHTPESDSGDSIRPPNSEISNRQVIKARTDSDIEKSFLEEEGYCNKPVSAVRVANVDDDEAPHEPNLRIVWEVLGYAFNSNFQIEQLTMEDCVDTLKSLRKKLEIDKSPANEFRGARRLSTTITPEDAIKQCLVWLRKIMSRFLQGPGGAVNKEVKKILSTVWRKVPVDKDENVAAENDEVLESNDINVEEEGDVEDNGINVVGEDGVGVDCPNEDAYIVEEGSVSVGSRDMDEPGDAVDESEPDGNEDEESDGIVVDTAGFCAGKVIKSMYITCILLLTHSLTHCCCCCCFTSQKLVIILIPNYFIYPF